MDLTTYITKTSGMSLRGIADAAGIQNSKLSRQLNGSSALAMETLRDVARGTGLHMLDLFQRAGFLTAAEVSEFREGFDVTRLTDKQIATEVLRRMERGSATLNQPIDAPIQAHRPVLTPEDLAEDFDLAADQHQPEDEIDYEHYAGS